MWTRVYYYSILFSLLNVLAFAQDLRYLRKQKLETTTPILLTTTSASARAGCTDGVWSSWSEFMPCNKECGACGTRVMQRECQTTGTCPCKGTSRREEVCNIKVCDYPQPACCPPHNLIVLESHFACGPQEESVINMFLENAQTIPALSRLEQRSKLEKLKARLHHNTAYTDPRQEISADEEHQANPKDHTNNLWVNSNPYYHYHSV